jgi:hypothetical protein
MLGRGADLLLPPGMYQPPGTCGIASPDLPLGCLRLQRH